MSRRLPFDGKCIYCVQPISGSGGWYCCSLFGAQERLGGTEARAGSVLLEPIRELFSRHPFLCAPSLCAHHLLSIQHCTWPAVVTSC